MYPVIWLILKLLSIYFYIVFLRVVLDVLVNFGIVNGRQPFVATVFDALYRLTEPVLAPIRRKMPNTGALDLSPVVVLLGL